MKTIYEMNHDGVIGRIIEPDSLDTGRLYAEQLQVWIGVDHEGKKLSDDEFEPRARLVVLELRNYLRDEFGMVDPPEGDAAETGVDRGTVPAAVEASTNGTADATVQSSRMEAATLIHSSKGSRWRIDVHRPEGVTDADHYIVFLTGDMGENVYRSRHMQLQYFRELMRGLEHARQMAPVLVADATDKVPKYPQSVSHETARADLFYITIALSRLSNGRIEPTLALYDAEDDTAPVLMAVEQEIDELYTDCTAAVAAAGVQD